jgi:outer membrane protein assembly factor BamB
VTARIEPVWYRKLDRILAGSFIWLMGDCFVLQLQPDRNGDRQEVIACFDLEGNPVWERRFDFDSINTFWPLAESLYVDGTLVRRLSVDTGETLVERDLGAPADSCGVVDTGPAYYVGEHGCVVGLDALTLEDVWRWPDPIGLTYPHGGLLCRYDLDGTMEIVELPGLTPFRRVQGPPQSEYGTTHGHVGDLWCQMYDLMRIGIDTRSGQVVWKKEEREARRHHLPAFVGEVAYAGDRDLNAYEMRTGDLLWRQPFGSLSCRPHIDGDRIYGGAKQGLVYAVDRHSGRVLSSFDAGFSPRDVRPLPGGRVLVASYEELLCFVLP